MSSDFSAAEVQFRHDLREFMSAELPEDWRGIFADEDSWKWSRQFCQALGRRGWLTPTWPQEYGGSEASVWYQTILQEEMWAQNEPRGPQYMNANWIGPALMHFGTDEQKRFFLPRMARGEVLWAQGFSEPEAGSDLAALRTSADVTEEGFIVSGRKIWVSYGDIADYIFLLCRTTRGSRRKDGCSVLLVDMTLPGVHVTRLKTPLGLHRQTEIAFDGAHAPASALLGSLNDGWSVAMRALSFERSGNARYGRNNRVLGILSRQYGEDWDAPHIEEFGRIVALARATELVNYEVTAAKDRGDASLAGAAVARVHNVVLETEVADFIEETAGVEAIISGADPTTAWNGEPENLWRNAPAGAITAGSLEIQLDRIAASGLGLAR